MESGAAIDLPELVEAELFADAAYRRYGVDFRGHEMQRLAARLRALARGLDSISALQGKMLRDPQLARASFRLLSESCTDFLTRPASFMALRCAVLPMLRSATWPVIWIAECTDPAFLIQLIVMLEEEALLARTQLFVTNANADVLQEVSALYVRAEDFPARDEQYVKGGGRAALGDYFREDKDGFVLLDSLRQHIVWSEHDLAADASFKECHIVILQRPLADYGGALRKRAIKIFAESLCNFGILQLDASTVPALSPELLRDFTCLLGEQGIYKRKPVKPGLVPLL